MATVETADDAAVESIAAVLTKNHPGDAREARLAAEMLVRACVLPVLGEQRAQLVLERALELWRQAKKGA